MEIGEVIVVVFVKLDQLRARVRPTASVTRGRPLRPAPCPHDLDHCSDGRGRSGRSRPPQGPDCEAVLARPRGAAPPVTPVMVRARAAPGAPGLDAVDRPTGTTHEVADQLSPAQLPPDHTRTRCYCVLCQDARRPLAPRAQYRPRRRHPRQPGTPGNCGRVDCRTARRGRRRTWAGSQPRDHARARGPEAHDALHWTCSIATRSRLGGVVRSGLRIVFDPVAIRRVHIRQRRRAKPPEKPKGKPEPGGEPRVR